MTVRELAQLGEERVAHPRGSFDEPVLAVGLERRRSRGAGERMAAVGRADPEHVRVEVMRDPVADDRPAERDVARGDSLPEGQAVGYGPLSVRADPATGRPEER